MKPWKNDLNNTTDGKLTTLWCHKLFSMFIFTQMNACYMLPMLMLSHYTVPQSNPKVLLILWLLGCCLLGSLNMSQLEINLKATFVLQPVKLPTNTNLVVSHSQVWKFSNLYAKGNVLGPSLQLPMFSFSMGKIQSLLTYKHWLWPQSSKISATQNWLDKIC